MTTTTTAVVPRRFIPDRSIEDGTDSNYNNTKIDFLSSTNTLLLYLVDKRRYFQHAHFIPIVRVGKRGEYYLVHHDLPRQYTRSELP